ncbi:hypothetical protein AFL46_14655 [Providencia stuartii]|nr:hypothetical protein AFL46_14655 [Providencia stuartii]
MLYDVMVSFVTAKGMSLLFCYSPILLERYLYILIFDDIMIFTAVFINSSEIILILAIYHTITKNIFCIKINNKIYHLKKIELETDIDGEKLCHRC